MDHGLESSTSAQSNSLMMNKESTKNRMCHRRAAAFRVMYVASAHLFLFNARHQPGLIYDSFVFC
jgi:hypothetical protein